MIYLSICIPTFNRSSYLRDTINSIVSQPEFTQTNEVEIVVSDNCSTDDTEIIMQPFLQKYSSKIKYHKNSQNIADLNFEKALSLGSGAMLKLNNDTLLLDENALTILLKIVKDCLLNDLIPFLLNGEVTKYHKNIICKDEITFIRTVSYWSTWIGGFMITKNEFNKIQNFSDKAYLRLTQVDVLYGLLQRGKSLIIIPDKLSTSVAPAKKGGYNLPEVFLTNYFEILKPYFMNKKGIKAYDFEKKEVLYKFILPWLNTLSVDNSITYSFETSGYEKIIKKEYSYLIFLNFKIRRFLFFTKMGIKKIHNTKRK